MTRKPTYEELEQKVRTLEKEVAEFSRTKEELSVVYDALNSSVSGVIITNLDGQIRYVNSAFLSMFDYKDNTAVLGENATVLFAPETLKRFSHVKAIIDETKGETEEFTAQRQDGTTFPVEVSSSNVSDNKANIVGRMASFVDITGRKQAEEALRESERRYRHITQAITDYIYTVRVKDGHPVETIHRPACVAVTGYTEDDFDANPHLWIQMVHEEDRRAVGDQAAQILSGVKVGPIERRIFRKDGVMRWIRNEFVPHYDSQGKLLSYDGLIRDIHEQKIAEQALRESEKKYSTLVENSLTGIYIDQDEKIVFANNRFAEIYRYPKEELIGIESWKLVHPDDRDLTMDMRTKRLKGEDAPSEYEARGLTKDGETIWINRRNARIEYKGKLAILGNVVDITEKKQAEEQLRKINEELKNFVRVVSHDLKNPIISIQGFSSRLLKKYQDKLGEKGRSYLELINAGARRMEVFVADLLALSSIGRVVSTFKDIPSLEILRNVTSGLEDRLREKGIDLVVADNLPAIYCDGERIYQVFENLLVNATKFMGATKDPKIEVGYEDREDFHQFYVRDNGIGIDPNYHKKIFEMFHRLREIEDETGTGLGLAIVERIVKHHGGKVWVESEKGQGAAFHFTLLKHFDL
ncbi:MAG: PAS domain S-box protein [Deltaproteobacteria bacterium]|nr:PAS domain S-box protein [Deltaproteobacteria bacterium]